MTQFTPRTRLLEVQSPEHVGETWVRAAAVEERVYFDVEYESSALFTSGRAQTRVPKFLDTAGNVIVDSSGTPVTKTATLAPGDVRR